MRTFAVLLLLLTLLTPVLAQDTVFSFQDTEVTSHDYWLNMTRTQGGIAYSDLVVTVEPSEDLEQRLQGISSVTLRTMEGPASNPRRIFTLSVSTSGISALEERDDGLVDLRFPVSRMTWSAGDFRGNTPIAFRGESTPSSVTGAFGSPGATSDSDADAYLKAHNQWYGTGTGTHQGWIPVEIHSFPEKTRVTSSIIVLQGNLTVSVTAQPFVRNLLQNLYDVDNTNTVIDVRESSDAPFERFGLENSRVEAVAFTQSQEWPRFIVTLKTVSSAPSQESLETTTVTEESPEAASSTGTPPNETLIPDETQVESSPPPTVNTQEQDSSDVSAPAKSAKLSFWARIEQFVRKLLRAEEKSTKREVMKESSIIVVGEFSSGNNEKFDEDQLDEGWIYPEITVPIIESQRFSTSEWKPIEIQATTQSAHGLRRLEYSLVETSSAVYWNPLKKDWIDVSSVVRVTPHAEREKKITYSLDAPMFAGEYYLCAQAVDNIGSFTDEVCVDFSYE